MMDQNENNVSNQTNLIKSQIILPLIFILSLTFGIMFVAVPNYLEDISHFIVWFYFGVAMLYTIIAAVDIFINKDRKKPLKIFIIIFTILALIATIFNIVFFFIGKGK